MRTLRPGSFRRAVETALTVAAALVICTSPALAQDKLGEVVVSSTPLRKNPFDLAQSVSVVDGEQLMLNAKPSIGETLSNQPGINASYFGQGSSRPIIRGLGGDRVRVLQGGVGVQDVSNTSPDHAVALEPIQADRVEVVRGPATLMYGPNAIGGVVNVLDGRIAETLPEGPASGALDLRGATVDGLRSAGARIDAPVGDFAIHLDGFYRRTDNYRIPGFARTGELRRQSPPDQGEMELRDKLPQSFTEAEGASVGVSYIFEKGFFGVAGNLFNTNYGLPNSEDVSINMQQRRLDMRGRIDDAVPFFERIETRTGIVSYEHTEFEGEEVGTIFQNDGIDSRLELTHSALGPVQGMIGFQYQYSDFDAVGGEAFIPATRTNTISGFVFEELAATESLSFQAGGRIDGNNVKTNQFRDGDSPETRSISPTALSGSLGTVYRFLDNYAAAATITHTERSATATELFANGPHFATGVFEVGDPTLGKERTLGLDLTLRKRTGWVTGFISGYHNRFNDYISLFPTGRLREGGHGHGEEEHGEEHHDDHDSHHDDEHAHHDEHENHDHEDHGHVKHVSGDIPEYRFRAVDANFFGAEAQVVFHLFGPKEELDEDSRTKQLARGISEPRSSHDRNHLDLSAQVDFVRAYVRNGGGNVPQTPPWRLLMAADYRREDFGARLEVQHVFEQDMVASLEDETSGFTLVNAILSHDFMLDCVSATGFLRVDNIFDDDARVHTSFIRNIAPLPGRNAVAGLRFRF